MDAEEFYKKHLNEHRQPKDKFDRTKKQFDYHDMIDFADSLVKNLSLANVMDKLPDTDFHCVECGHGIHNGICPNCNK